MNSKTHVIGEDSRFLDSLSHASQLAEIDRPVLIFGERGSGKELVAERMHFLSPRWEEPFLKLNCAALTDSLVESSLFGHEAGAFTGAQKTHQGYFERVQSGTLFLDEIATLSLRIQEKLLRVLEYGEFERIGGSETLITNARIVAASHANLLEMSRRQAFRSDLLDRLVFDVVHVPPLRARGKDLFLLADHFAANFALQLGWEDFPGFSELAKVVLEEYPWPGNVRELKNVIERSLFRWEEPGREINAIHIDPFVPPWESPRSLNGQLNDPKGAQRESDFYPVDFKSLRLRWELHQLKQAMEACNHHQGKAAAALSLSYDQFRAIWKKKDGLSNVSGTEERD